MDTLTFENAIDFRRGFNVCYQVFGLVGRWLPLCPGSRDITDIKLITLSTRGLVYNNNLVFS